MNKLFWTVFVFSFATIAAGKVTYSIKGQEMSEGYCGVFNFQKKYLISVLASKKWSNQKIKGKVLR